MEQKDLMKITKQVEIDIPIKKCPYCGYDFARMTYSYSTNDGTIYSIICNSCKSRGPEKETQEDAVVAWNERK